MKQIAEVVLFFSLSEWQDSVYVKDLICQEPQLTLATFMRHFLDCHSCGKIAFDLS